MLPLTCPVCKKETLDYGEDIVTCPSCELYTKELKFYQKVAYWTQDKNWWIRLPVIALFFWFFIRCLQNPQLSGNRTDFLSVLDLGIHELGHFLFMAFGEFMHILGGSLFQCLNPILWMIGCIQKKWYFTATMCWCWLGYNLYDVSVYAGDARARLLPLVGPGGLGDGSDAAYDAGHDWYQLLLRTNHLSADLAIAKGLRIAGALCFVIGFVLAAILLFKMMTASAKKPAPQTLY